MRRVGTSPFGGITGGDEFSVEPFDLPPYEPSPKPPRTPQELVAFALKLAQQYDANDLSGQARSLESVARMHLEGGRNEAGILALATSDRLLQQHTKQGGNPLDQFSFYGRASRMLRELGHSQPAAFYAARQVQLMNNR